MRRCLRACLMLVTVSMLLPTFGYSADFQKGLDAYNRKDFITSLREWTPLAKQGVAEAQNGLGVMYSNGNGVLQDFREAIKWYRLAAAQGYSFAQYNLGEMYEKGLSVPQNYVEAIKWYRTAVEQYHPLAQYKLATLYYSGLGVQQNYKTALELLNGAAKQGHVDSQGLLGWMYQYGEGTPINYKEAIKWYRLAVDQRDARAQNSLGEIYEKGLGVPQDFGEAVKWYRLAVEQGNLQAKFRMGRMYENGWGVGKDIKKAIEWYSLVVDKKDNEPDKELISDAQEALARLSAHNSQAEVSQSPKSTPSYNITPFPLKPINVSFDLAPLRPADIAVIIGNADYKKLGIDIPNVTPAYADAAGIKQYFTQALGVPEGNIIFIKDATSAQLVSVFGKKDNHKGKLFNWVKPKISKVYVYYAGHGAPSGEEGSTFMIPSDASTETIYLTGYPLSTLYMNLSKIPAESITVILEACFSGFSQGGALISNASPIFIKTKTPEVPSNITVISAGGRNQMASWEKDKSHSLFTKYFLMGMSGEADAKPYGDDDGIVNYKELEKYLAGTMTYFARRYYGRNQTVQIVNGR